MISLLAILVGAGMIKSYQMVFDTLQVLLEDNNARALAQMPKGNIVLSAAGIVGFGSVVALCFLLGKLFLFVVGL